MNGLSRSFAYSVIQPKIFKGLTVYHQYHSRCWDIAVKPCSCGVGAYWEFGDKPGQELDYRILWNKNYIRERGLSVQQGVNFN